MAFQFSVTLSCYKNDKPEFFETAFYSIVNQTVKPDEIIITVDGPIPQDLDELICRLEKEYNTVVLRSDINEGLGLAHAKAVQAAKYEYVAIMDSDDIARKDRFEKQIAFLKAHPEVDLLGGQIEEFIGSPDNIVGLRKVPLSNKEIYKYMRIRQPLNHMTFFFKKESVLNVGNYEDWHYDEDYFLICKMAKAGMVFANLPDVLVNVRVGEEMYKRRGGFRYFVSERELQKWMLENKLISYPVFLFNVMVRFFVQVILSNNVRGNLFKNAFRKSK